MTTTSTTAGTCKAVVAVICVELKTVNVAAAVPPKVTAVAPAKFEPVIVTTWMPAAGPMFGATSVIPGRMYEYAPGSVDVPPGATTVTSTGPATVTAGVVAVIDVEEITVKVARRRRAEQR